MTFSKNFPRSSDKSAYPKWIEIKLSEEEEKQAEKECREHNLKVMSESIEDAKVLVHRHKLMETQIIISSLAVALFEKRASHEVFFKENIAKMKFESKQN